MNFADRWPRWTGARLIKVHLHSKSFGGGVLKWPLKRGSRLIEVAATAGLTVSLIREKKKQVANFLFSNFLIFYFLRNNTARNLAAFLGGNFSVFLRAKDHVP